MSSTWHGAGPLPGMVRTGATFADAAAEFLRYTEHDRGCKPSTLRDYRSNLDAHLLPAFGSAALDSITPAAIDAWRSSLTGSRAGPRTSCWWVMDLFVLFTTPQQVDNRYATCEREQAAILMVVLTLPLLYAHRLGRDPGPDSSRAALRATLVGPVDGLETDACLTADGRLVLLHDPWLSSSTTSRGWAHQTAWSDLRGAHLRDRDGAPTAETPMLLEELLDDAPGDLRVQVEVKAYGDPELARATATAVCRVVSARPDRGRVEVLSFHSIACEETVRHGMPARLVVWADYAPGALARWAARVGVGGVCIEHFLLHPALVERLRVGGLSVTTGTVNDAVLAAQVAALGVDAITTDRPAALHHELAAMSLAA